MGNKEREKPLDLSIYRPLVDEDVVFIAEVLPPAREFGPGEHAKWVASLTPGGVVIVNFVHRAHPDAICQVQCVQDDEGSWGMFFYHISPTYNFIPDKTAEALAQEVFPKLMAILEEGPVN